MRSPATSEALRPVTPQKQQSQADTDRAGTQRHFYPDGSHVEVQGRH